MLPLSSIGLCSFSARLETVVDVIIDAMIRSRFIPSVAAMDLAELLSPSSVRIRLRKLVAFEKPLAVVGTEPACLFVAITADCFAAYMTSGTIRSS